MSSLRVTTRHGLIVHVEGSDDATFTKFGVAVDPELLENVGGVELLHINASHYQMRKVFGFDKSLDAKSNLWLIFLKQLREHAMSDALTEAYKKVDAEADEFAPSVHLKREKLFKDLPELLTILLPDLPCGRKGMQVKVKKASRWNNELLLEVNGPILEYLMNAMYTDPPMQAEPPAKKKPRQDSPRYAEYPHVRAWQPKKGGPLLLCVKPLMSNGKIKQITRSVPQKARDDADGGISVELKLAAELEEEFARRNIGRAGSHDGQAVASVTGSPAEDGGEEVAPHGEIDRRADDDGCDGAEATEFPSPDGVNLD